MPSSPSSGSSNKVAVYSALVSRSWDPRALKVKLPKGLSPSLKVEKDDRVWVYHLNQGYGLVHRPVGDTYQRGWVLLDILIKGVERANELPIELPSQVRTVGQNATQAVVGNRPSENVLHETLRDLWRTIKSNETALKEIIPSMSEKSREIFFHQRAPQYADLVYDCVSPQARTIMSSGRFSVDQLRTLRQVSPEWPKQAGVYIILYNDFGGRKLGNNVYNTAIYIGQTVDFQGRLKQHNRATEAKASIHYRLAGEAKRKVMVPLLLKTSNDVPPYFLDVAEFSFVCLLRSWCSALFRPSENSAIGSYGLDFDGCLAFSGLMRTVSSRTGWKPNPTYGLNWHTPILIHPRPNYQWTSWYSDNEEMYFFRTRRNLKVNKASTEIHWQLGIDVTVPVKVVQEAGFEHGQAVHLVVEVRKKKDEYLTHPFRFIRFPPKIGPNPELEKLRSLAVQIQWVDKEGQWKQYYLERTLIWQPFSKSNPLPRIYGIGLFILCDVEQTYYTSAPGWLLPTPPTRVQFLRYEHLAQKNVVEIVQPKTLPWPRDNTMERNAERLLELFPAGSGTVIGRRPGPQVLGQRSACDMCISQRTTTKCQYNPRDDSCQCCRALNRPCTWSELSGNITDAFVYGEELEELGIAVNLSRNEGAAIKNLAEAPFDPAIEEEEHGNLADN